MFFVRRSIATVGVIAAFLMWGCGSEMRPRVLCFGDSLTAGFLAESSGGYPQRLSELLRTPVLNAGSTGDTSFAALARVDAAIEKNPSHIIVEIGANDYLLKIDPAACRENLEKCLDKFKKRNIHVAMLLFFNDAMLETSNESDRKLLMAYKAMYEEVGRAYDVPIVHDIWGSVFSDKNLMTDSYHPNAAGYKIMGKLIYDDLSKRNFFN